MIGVLVFFVLGVAVTGLASDRGLWSALGRTGATGLMAYGLYSLILRLSPK